MKIVGLDHVVIRCVDAEKMVRFYCDVIGCGLDRHRPELGLYHLRAGRSLIDIIPVSGKLGREGGGPPAPGARNMDHLCLRIDDFDEATLRARFRQHGIDLGERHDNYGAEGVGPSFYVKDPEGNTVELKGPCPAGHV